MKKVTLGLLLKAGISIASNEGIVLTALSYMERPYRFGANELYRMDCSAFVQRVFMVNGIRLPRTTLEQAQVGVPVDPGRLRPGDLLFFTTYRPGPSHVGIYIGKGKFIHASERKGVTISSIYDPYWSRRFLFARRIEGMQNIRQAGTRTVHSDEIADLIRLLTGY